MTEQLELARTAEARSPSNRRVQPTPLAASEIVAILEAGFVTKVVSIYWCGAADAQGVGRWPINANPVYSPHYSGTIVPGARVRGPCLMHVDLKGFLQSGTFGLLTLATSRQQLVAVLGSPQHWGPQPDVATAEIWKYGCIEFYFPEHGDALQMIFSDQLERLDSSTQFTIEPWIVRPNLRLDGAEVALQSNQLRYRRVDRPELDAIDLVLESSVVLRFYRRKIDQEYYLSSFWCGDEQANQERS